MLSDGSGNMGLGRVISRRPSLLFTELGSRIGVSSMLGNGSLPGPHQSQLQGQHDSLQPGRKDVLVAVAETWKRHSRHATG